MAAFAIACCIAALGVLDALQLNGTIRGNGTYRLFALDAELTGPAVFSCLLLLVASVAALALAQYSPETRIRFVPTIALGLVLAFMALDEVASFHERLEQWTGIDWQVLYLPVAAVAAGVWLITLRGLRRFGTGGVPFLCGGLAWLMSQAFEFVQWADFNSDRVVHSWAVVPEEILEMGGSALFALGLVAALQAAAPRLPRRVAHDPAGTVEEPRADRDADKESVAGRGQPRGLVSLPPPKPGTRDTGANGLGSGLGQ